MAERCASLERSLLSSAKRPAKAPEMNSPSKTSHTKATQSCRPDVITHESTRKSYFCSKFVQIYEELFILNVAIFEASMQIMALGRKIDNRTI